MNYVHYNNNNSPHVFRTIIVSLLLLLLLCRSTTPTFAARMMKKSLTPIPEPIDQLIDQARMKQFILKKSHNNLVHEEETRNSERNLLDVVDTKRNIQESDNNNNDTSSILSYSCTTLCIQCIEIETYFHMFTLPIQDGGYVIPHPTSAVANASYYDVDTSTFSSLDTINTMIDEQMVVLNDAFNSTPFQFVHVNRDNPTISTIINYTTYAFDYSTEMSAIYGINDLKALNIFLSLSVSSQNMSIVVTDVANDGTNSSNTTTTRYGQAVAFSSFPSFQKNKSGDGVFIRYDALVNGGYPGSDHGYTLVHEVGHWLGLYHTFQRGINFDPKNFGTYDPCEVVDDNDFVIDTPAMAYATEQLYPDCTVLIATDAIIPDTCPNIPGNDPVFNWMNYLSDETCFVGRGEFTCGQIERMYLQWHLYRDREKCPNLDKEMEIEIFIKFDQEWFVFENKFYLETNDGQEVVYNSTCDLDPVGTLTSQDRLLVDLCVPIGTYKFVFEDSAGDGTLAGSYFEIYINGKSIQKVEGDFGYSSTVVIPDPTSPDFQQTIENNKDGNSNAQSSSSGNSNPYAPTTISLVVITVISLFLLINE